MTQLGSATKKPKTTKEQEHEDAVAITAALTLPPDNSQLVQNFAVFVDEQLSP